MRNRLSLALLFFHLLALGACTALQPAAPTSAGQPASSAAPAG